ncbi:MAG: DMT family transporter [Chitinophagaceae bacterium]
MAISNQQKNIYTGIGLAMITVLIWSGNYVVAKGVSKQMPAVSLAFYRWSLASVCIMPFAIKKFNQQKSLILASSNYIFWTALTGVTIFNTFIYLGSHYTSAINLALIGTTSAPVFVTFMGALFLKEKITRYRITGMLICIAGVAFLLSQGSLQKLASFHFGIGDVLVLISAFAFAIYNTLVKKKPAAISPIVFLFTIFTLGTLLLLPFFIYVTMHSPAIAWNANMLYVIIYLGVGNSIIAFLCWNASIEKLGSSGTALFANLIPIFSTIEAVIFLGEDFSDIHLISGLIVISGLIIANITRSAVKQAKPL